MKAIKYLPLVVIVALSACGEKTSTKEPVAAETSPPVSASVAATVVPTAPAVSAASAASVAPSAADLAKGEKVFTATCVACHGAGVLGAPKFGDKVAWAPRIAQGIDTLHAHALDGVKLMPPRGGNAVLKDDDVKAAVDYMVSKGT